MPTLQSASGPDKIRREKWLPVLICLALAIMTVLIYGSVRDCDFINLDDNRYVYENAHVQSGFNKESLKHAFSFDVSNWHPLTWLSWMLDHRLFGLNPAGYHLVNLLFHVANTLLLFLVLRRMTRRIWPSAFVAALFAAHPLHVESVAWISERKDVLSAFFWILAMGAYGYYVERPQIRRYALVMLFFAFGLMSKPMTITLPFALLLLDYWPLRRFPITDAHPQNGAKENLLALSRLLWEKAPLFALTILSGVITYLAQREGGATQGGKVLSVAVRVGNAVISYVAYLGQMIWPRDLAVLYPHPEKVQLWPVLGAAFLLIAITAAVIWRAKKSPYLVTGWFWYLGTLVPVIGLVQVGIQSRADRYTYLSLIGVFIMVAWGASDLLKKWRYGRAALTAASAAILMCLAILTVKQVGYWQNSITLYDHTLGVTQSNWLIYNNRGNAHNVQGRYQRAIDDYDMALGIKPQYAEAYLNRGAALNALGNERQAIEDFSRAIAIRPDHAEAYINRGAVYNNLGRYREGLEDLNRGIGIKPGYAEAYFSRGVAYGALGRNREAIEDFDRAIHLKPGFAGAYINRAVVYFNQGDRPSGCRDAKTACDLGGCDFLEAATNEGLCR